MDSFAPEDVRRYYINSFIRDPRTNDVVQVAEVDRGTNEALLFSLKGIECGRVALKSITWGHVRIPKLGYRSIGDKFLYYVTKKVGSITVKGVQPHTIAVETSPALSNIIRSISDKEYSNYGAHAQVRRGPLIGEIFSPDFTSFADAVKKVLLGKAYAIAISHDFALSLGKRADRALTLYLKGWQPVAYSEDGERWALVHEAFKDVIQRGVGDIRYA